MPRRVLEGVVVSNASQQTVVVRVEDRVQHPIYRKYIMRSKKYAAHDPQEEFKMGDVIRIIESRPLSKTKKWHVIYEGPQAQGVEQ